MGQAYAVPEADTSRLLSAEYLSKGNKLKLSARTIRWTAAAATTCCVLAGGLSAPAQALAPLAAVLEAPTNLQARPLENPIDPSKPLVRLFWKAPTVGATPTAYKVYVDGGDSEGVELANF